MVPVTWLKNKNNAYPIIIDPIVLGNDKVGSYRFDHKPIWDQGFTTYTVDSGYCSYNLPVRVLGKSSLTNHLFTSRVAAYIR